MLFSVDGTFLVQLVNFAIFFALVNVLFIKPVREAIAERRRYIDSLVADYDSYAAEVTKLRAEAELRRAVARREADAALTAARHDIASEIDRMNAEFAERSAHIVAHAHAVVEQETAQARASEDRLVRGLADEMLARAFAVTGS